MPLRPSFSRYAPHSRKLFTPVLCTGALLAALTGAVPAAAQAPRCAAKVDAHLASLPLAPGDVKSIRIIEKVNIADDIGPEILGVDAWVRLHSCTGWLVINMTAKCYVRQSYTRGDCRIEGLSNY